MEGSNKQQEAINLRVKERLGLKVIASRLNISKSTASLWLRDYPLNSKTIARRMQDNGRRTGGRNKYDPGLPSKYYCMKAVRHGFCSDTPLDYGSIAEAAVAFRLYALGLNVLTNMFNGGSTDFVVQVPSGRLAKLQVKWGKQGRHGRQIFRVMCSDGRDRLRRYKPGELDFLIGYDLFTDDAHVFHWDELKNIKSTISAKDKSCEAWYKLFEF